MFVKKSYQFSERFYASTIILVVVFFVSFQIFDLNVEYRRLDNLFNVHHDEKLIVPDARALYLGKPQMLKDYTEPISACFGILGPRIAQLGFNIFGLNNYGLRFNFVVLSGIATLLLALLMLRLVPGINGFLLSLFQVLNYHYFFLTRHAILENILILFLAIIFYLYLIKRDFFLKYINQIAFLGGALILLKQNFPFYYVVLIGSFAIAERFSFRRLFKLVMWSFIGVLFFSGMQMIILYRMNLLDENVDNIVKVAYAHTGNYGKYTSGLLQTHFKPPGIDIFTGYCRYAVGWYLLRLPSFISPTLFGSVIFISFLLAIVFLYRKKNLSKITISLGLFLAVNLLVASQFFFYMKRALPIVVFTLFFIASVYNDILKVMSDERKKKIGIAVSAGLIILLLFRIFIQANYMYNLEYIRTNGIEENSRRLDKMLPKGATIYMQCYGSRFLWQSRNRIISADDQYMNNAMMLDKALREGGKYLVLAVRGLDERNTILSNTEKINIGRGCNIRLIKEYWTEQSDSDFTYYYLVYEIVSSGKSHEQI